MKNSKIILKLLRKTRLDRQTILNVSNKKVLSLQNKLLHYSGISSLIHERMESKLVYITELFKFSNSFEFYS